MSSAGLNVGESEAMCQRWKFQPHGNPAFCTTRTLQPTCYPCDYPIVNEDGNVFDGSNRYRVARTRLNSALVCARWLICKTGRRNASGLPTAVSFVGVMCLTRHCHSGANKVESLPRAGNLWLPVPGRVASSRWAAIRKTSCPNKLPVAQLVPTPGTRFGRLVEAGIGKFDYVP